MNHFREIRSFLLETLSTDNHGRMNARHRRFHLSGFSMTQDLPTQLPSPVLLIGPAYSGKTDLATRYLRPDQGAIVIGTALNIDPQTSRRLTSLKERRPAQWESLDSFYDLAVAVSDCGLKSPQILVDSVNQWLANLLVQGELSEGEEDQRLSLGLLRVDELAKAVHGCRSERVVVVSAEIGASPAPSRPLERLFRQLVGLANQRLAEVAQTVLTVHAGIAHPIKLTK